MKVRELMTKDVACCRPSTSLNDAAHLMWTTDCGSLPVVSDEHRVIGMVTDRDACMAAYHTGKGLKEIPVGSAMSRSVISCGPEDDISDAAGVMAQAQIRRLPVVDGAGRLTGLLTLAKIARASNGTSDVPPEDVGGTLSSISRPTAGAHASSGTR